jgi:hypothetical protein
VKHASLRGAVVSALLGVAGLGIFLSGGEACATRECLPSDTLNYTSGGDFPDPNTWESTPVDGNWLHYQPVSAIYIEIPEFANREVLTTTAYISGVYNPNAVAVGPNAVTNNYAEASGNLAEFQQVRTVPSILNADEKVLALTVVNGTCAEYYIRIVVTAAPAEAGGDDAGDAGADTDAGVADADSGDASLD